MNEHERTGQERDSQAAEKDMSGVGTKSLTEAASGPTLASETPTEPTAPAPAGSDVPQARSWRLPGLRPYALQAAALAAALGLGWLGGSMRSAHSPEVDPAMDALRKADWTGLAAGMQKSQADSARIVADVQGFKASLNGMRDLIDRARQENGQRLAQVGERLDRVQRADQEVAAKLAALAERVERWENSGRETGAKLTQVLERLDRLERQTAPGPSAAAAKAAADPHLHTGAIPQTKPTKQESKSAPIEGWILREVYDGVALVEGRNRRLHEIAPGSVLPGAGRVEAIERRGRSWVVVTTQGVITSQQW